MSELKLMEFAAAEADCTQAIRLDPSYTKAYLRRASAFKALGKLLEAAEDYESALRLEPTSQATAADRRACLNLLYQQEQLQHELPRVPVTPSAQQPVPGTVASPSRQADHQPADALKQTPASTSRTSEQAADLSAHAQQKANVSAEAQQTVSASARQAATSASAPQAATSASTQHQAGRRGQQPIHTQQAAQKPQSPQQPFGRRGMPSCVIEELPNEPDPEPPFNPQPIAASPSSPAAAAPQPRQKQGSKQRGSDSEQGNVSAQADSTASTAGASECASASGEMPSAADTASVGRGGNPASLPSTSTELPLSLSPSQTTAPASQHDPKSNARPVTVVQATAEQQTPGTSAVPAQAGATTSSAAAQAQAAGPDASLSQTSIIQQASSAKDGPTSVRNAAPSPASLGQPTATLSSHSRTGQYALLTYLRIKFDQICLH